MTRLHYLMPVMLIPALAAASPFAGLWKLDPAATQLPAEPESLSLEKGIFTCETCRPRISVPADGKDHHVDGAVLFDAVNVSAEADGTVHVTQKRAGQVLRLCVYRPGADGKSMGLRLAEPHPSLQITADLEYERQGAPEHPSGITGNWIARRLVGLTPGARDLRIQDVDSGLLISYPDGRTLRSAFDGADQVIEGTDGAESAHLSLLGGNTAQINRRYRGSVIEVARMSVTGNRMKITNVDWLAQRRTVWTLDKQTESTATP